MTDGFQRRTSKRADQMARDRQLREDRLAAYGAFAGAIMDYRRAQYDRVHRRLQEPEGPAHLEARNETYRLRSAAQQEFFRLRLVSDDRQLTQSAERALALAESIHHADTRKQVDEAGTRAKAALDEFITAASATLSDARGRRRFRIRR
ncbi:hypothetical protein [Actinomadura rupiterrae]|uniref:hypothetical protein n=1 Tax=Actinomadura rupiterrae TaxID=559627 RepID=UPI0020A51A5B|nr:hypothetical protein [Actinomadura rupiterrae]MCP2342509.1 hypothetical protein [Actinomadura rupiterrae]